MVKLPTKSSYRIGIDTLLLAVGGTLRILGIYDQRRTGFPFEKIQNYTLTVTVIDSLDGIYYLKTNEISSRGFFSSTRVETIVGYIYNNLMFK